MSFLELSNLLESSTYHPNFIDRKVFASPVGYYQLLVTNAGKIHLMYIVGSESELVTTNMLDYDETFLINKKLHTNFPLLVGVNT